MADEEKIQENIENDVPLMTSDDPFECFEIECDEDETDCTKCCACELEEINFCAKPCGHLMCTFCIEEDKVWNATQKLTQNLQYFLSSVIIILFCAQLIFRVSSVFAWEFRRILVDSSVSDLILVIWIGKLREGPFYLRTACKVTCVRRQFCTRQFYSVCWDLNVGQRLQTRDNKWNIWLSDKSILPFMARKVLWGFG